MPDQPTLATRANMRAFREANPEQQVGTATILRPTCFAWSPNTDEQCSADDGDYFTLPDDEPLRDSEGEPMFLVRARTIMLDALTGEPWL